MGHFVLFSLFLIGFCAVSFAAPKDFSWSDSFVLPSRNRVINRPSLGITGGQVAKPHQFPYQVGMYVTYRQETAFCGGSLISPNYVLTAAHCVDGAKRFHLYFGAHNVTENEESGRQEQFAIYYTIHPGWDVSTVSNDLAIIELDEPVTLNNNVQVIKIASGDETYAGKQGTASGWGRMGNGDTPRSDVLRYTTNSILSNADCKASNSDYAKIIKDTNICSSGKGSKGICKGDSGGPIVSNGVQVGLSSFAYNDCAAGLPSVFTRLSKYVDWIKENSDI